ncbi:hypothetical protein SAMN05446589_0183 [Streptomyces sp. OV198]|uniref:hypothetical protein n=1 Tax=Streptomyces sp. OV198 TaxID=1882787 RepID=UPI000BC815D2|nr:hypothetical protein [Streptomyces sp. OV198]SOE48106.1 hypothetical protein SAMN05446589_0183 [Streptomyces sp. OV198]
MALEMIPDRPGREAVFEPLLDELLAQFSPDWVMPERMVGARQHHRCEVKRWEIGRAAEADPDLTLRHADLLVHAAMHDQCRSGINQLVRPLVNVLGYRWVQEEIIRYVRTGSGAEKVGATMAWYFARPPIKYASWEERIPTSESKEAVEALSDLRDCYRDAVLAAFLSCEDPGVRQDLSLWVSLDPSVYPDDLQIAQKRAKDIILADPEHYRWLLQRSGHG